jgi:hypothetical protein
MKPGGIASRIFAIDETSNLDGGKGAADADCDGAVDGSGLGSRSVEHPPTMIATVAIAPTATPRNAAIVPAYAHHTALSDTNFRSRTARSRQRRAAV